MRASVGSAIFARRARRRQGLEPALGREVVFLTFPAKEASMTNRRDFLSLLAAASWAAAACAGERPVSEDELERALENLNQAAGIGIAEDDFTIARSYAAGAYREAAKSLKSIALDPALDLPVAFAAKRAGR
jgi:hypothetical protein